MDRVHNVHTYIASQHFRLNQYFKELCIFRLVYFGVLLTSRFSCCLTLQLFRDSVHTINLTMGNLLNSNGGVFSWMPLNPCSNLPSLFLLSYSPVASPKVLPQFRVVIKDNTTIGIGRGSELYKERFLVCNSKTNFRICKIIFTFPCFTHVSRCLDGLILGLFLVRVGSFIQICYCSPDMAINLKKKLL